MKYLLLAASIIGLLYITSCIKHELEFLTPVPDDISLCSAEYITRFHPSSKEIEEKIMGQWRTGEFDSTSIDLLLNDDRKYYILDNNVILNSGAYSIVQFDNIIGIDFKSNLSQLDNNSIEICGDYIYNNRSKKMWHRICDCFIK